MDDMTTPLRGLGPPVDHSYATWDAAYVLGSLSATERREYETHMADCAACRAAVAEMSGVPGLLAKLSREDVAEIDESFCAAGVGPASPPVSPTLLPSLLDAVRRRRRRTRVVAWVASAAAAVVLTLGVFVGVQGFSTPAHEVTVSAQPMAQVGTSLLASTVSVTGQHWGTFINLKCVCLAPPDAPHDTLAMVVVGRDGSQSRLATWVAAPGHTATPAGSTALPVDQIAAVQVVSADTGKVLLERSL
ncbi:anti-sigma factor family protein [Mycobacterium bourgelatii]|uniref:Anti-sigma-L factor RslA n=1 Tax=Mycobacterium bourgelatii TaxID=1273442 RepID=A0A7I9YJ42_MYCBU|nr:zf-HC2 domain-containing protein [Mycobacterium bourgelatii]GFG88639.1 anti-sigma-L factor RslA [Mycobacterium bourgelatii]